MVQSITIVGSFGPAQLDAARLAAMAIDSAEVVLADAAPFHIQVRGQVAANYVDIVPDSALHETTVEYVENEDLPEEFRRTVAVMAVLRVYYTDVMLFRRVIVPILLVLDRGDGALWVDDDYGAVHRVNDYVLMIARMVGR